MNDQDYIKAAVELADGFTPDALQVSSTEDMQIGFEEQFFLDALAAQLVRQVDALDGFLIIFDSLTPLAAAVFDNRGNEICDSDGPDRTMNTLRAIVDSEVLK